MITKTKLNDIVKEQIKKATDQNILVYDCDAKCGKLSIKALSLLSLYMSNIYDDQLIKFIIDDRVNTDDILEEAKSFYDNYINIEFITKDFTKYFLSLDAMLAGDDKYLILAVGKNNSLLLGSC